MHGLAVAGLDRTVKCGEIGDRRHLGGWVVLAGGFLRVRLLGHGQEERPLQFSRGYPLKLGLSSTSSLSFSGISFKAWVVINVLFIILSGIDPIESRLNL